MKIENVKKYIKTNGIIKLPRSFNTLKNMKEYVRKYNTNNIVEVIYNEYTHINVDFQKETAYDECVYGHIEINDNDELQVNLTIYNGDILYGHPTSIRHIYKILIVEFDAYMEKAITRDVKKLSEFIFEERERIKKEKAITKIENDIIKQLG